MKKLLVILLMTISTGVFAQERDTTVVNGLPAKVLHWLINRSYEADYWKSLSDRLQTLLTNREEQVNDLNARIDLEVDKSSSLERDKAASDLDALTHKKDAEEEKEMRKKTRNKLILSAIGNIVLTILVFLVAL